MTTPAERSERNLILWLLLFAGAVRVLFLLISANATSDGPPRAVYAGDWAQHPVIVTHGHWLPLQLYLSGLLLMVWDNIWVMPRLVSLVFGVATMWPVWRVIRLRFSVGVATASVVLLALYGLHIAQSVVSSSEAVFLFVAWWALYHFVRWWDTQELSSLGIAGLFWVLAIWTKPEAWWVSAISGFFVVGRVARAGRRGLAPVALYGALLSLGVGLWLVACAVSKGDPFYTFHATTAAVGEANRARPLWYRLAFWPIGLTLSLGPVVVLLAVAGVFKAVRDRGPMLPLLFAGAYVLPFLGLQIWGGSGINARHTLLLGTWLLPYAAYAVEQRFTSSQLARWTLAVAAAWLLIVLALGETRRGEISQKFASISPRPKERWHVTEVTEWVRRHVAPADRVVVDCFNDEESSLQYQVQLPPAQVRIYWSPKQSATDTFTPPPRFVVQARKGALAKGVGLDWNAVTQEALGWRFERRYTNAVYAVFEVVPAS